MTISQARGSLWNEVISTTFSIEAPNISSTSRMRLNAYRA